jgi:glycosyltransferase involved in cell wall biosynthesis
VETLEKQPTVISREPKKVSSWLQVVSHVSPVHGGIAQTVPQMARATEAQGSHVCPIAAFCDAEEVEHMPTGQRGSVEIFPKDRRLWLSDGRSRSRFKKTITETDGIHIHGIWEAHSVIAAHVAKAKKRPYIVSVHGMLEPWALQHKRIKKALYAAFFETRVLQGAACLRALTTDEVDDYRRLGLSSPIAVVPSGVEVPDGVNADLFYEMYPQLRGKRIVLFLGRLHPKKGLPLLLQAWGGMSRPEDAHLVIAGPDSENTLAALSGLRDDLKIESSVTFAGMLRGSQKWSCLAAASLFVLPSYSEGFSIAVLEAMGMGVPVLVTVGCHIPEVTLSNCGWVIQPELDPLREALEQFYKLSAREVSRTGERGRELVEQRFRWSAVGRQMAQVYDWAAGGPKPTEVTIG